LKVHRPGWSLIVTAEDQRERLVARMREILDGMDLTPMERRRVQSDVAIWDVTGEQKKLTFASDGNLQLTTLADEIVEAHKDDPPVVVLFDPMVSFGVSEERVNDNEQALVTAARRIVRGLGCCVRYIHHTGKANARDKALDQYSGRGGSALADGTRMTTVLQAWHPDDKLTPPPGCHPDAQSSIIVMARPKLSYVGPNLPLIWIKRTGHTFEHFIEFRVTPEQKMAASVEQLHQFLTWELQQDRRYTKNQLDESLGKLGMTRAEMREALTELQVSGRVVDADLPTDQRQGRRKTYLHPVQSADTDGGILSNLEDSQ
jgi:RecA-family ATPase